MHYLKTLIVGTFAAGSIFGGVGSNAQSPTLFDLDEHKVLCLQGDKSSCGFISTSYWTKISLENKEGFQQDACRNKEMANFCGTNFPRVRDHDRFKGTERDVLLEILKSACASDVEQACTSVASLLSHQDGTTDFNHIAEQPDHDAALLFRMQACELGNERECGKIVNLYFWGSGNSHRKYERDPDLANSLAARRERITNFLEERCNREIAQACYGLGQALAQPANLKMERAFGIAPDHESGIPILEKACNLESADSCETLSNLFDPPYGRHISGDPEPDLDRAISYRYISCDQGDADTCFKLSGLLVDSDPNESRRFHQRACTLQPRKRTFKCAE